MKTIEVREDGSLRVSHSYPGSKNYRVKQEPAYGCSLTNLVNKYTAAGGKMSDLANSYLANLSKLQFEDSSSGTTFHQMQNLIVSGKQAFDSLPSDIREKFRNRYEDFIAWYDDPKNNDEKLKLGLLKKIEPKVDPVFKVEVTNPVTSDKVEVKKNA